MNKINFLVKILVIIMLLSIICPVSALAEEEIQEQLKNIEEHNENNLHEKINDEEVEDKNISENDNINKNIDNIQGNKVDDLKSNIEINRDNILENDEIIDDKKEENANIGTVAKVRYNSHIQDYGWEEDFSKKDGEISGTTGKSKRIEAIKISLGNDEKIISTANIEYQVHVQDIGWMNWKRNGELAGTIGQSKRIEAIKVRLVGLDECSVIYRVHVQDIGWTKWTSDGELAGTTGKSKRIEAIQIQILDEKYKDASFSIVDGENKVNEYRKNNKHYLFVPKNMDISNLMINYDGNIVETTFGQIDKENKVIAGDFSNNENFTITSVTGEKENISVIQSDVPALFVDLYDNVEQSTLDNGSKDIKYSASLNVYGSDNGQYDISDSSIEIKGRGNSTWLNYTKKPYQIKLSKKKNLLGIGNGEAKKWVLIANSTDSTLLRNKIMNDLCVNSELSPIPNCKFADLYINGNYVGNYLVCDKVEVGKTRINLKNDNGVIAELDNAYYNEEDYNFKSPYNGDHFAIKEFKNDDADENTKKAVTKQFQNDLQNFEKLLYDGKTTWEQISKLIDVESFAKYYLLTEFAENSDSYYSSTYLYKDGPDDVIHMGPTWDYDGAFGKQKTAARGEYPDVDFTLNYCSPRNYMRILFLYPQFAEAVNKIYENEVKENLNEINVKEYANKIKQASRINSIVWHSEREYNEWINYLNNWVKNRVNYFNKTYYSSKYDANVLYVAHTETQGWNKIEKDGSISGTIGQAKRLEGIKIYLGNQIDSDVSIQYQTHVQDIGWQDWKTDGELAGTEGIGKRIEAIKIKLKNTEDYSVMYRVHVQDIGWQDWKTDGSLAGTTGQGKRIEAIEIKVVEKQKRFKLCVDTPNDGDKYYTSETSNISVSGWKMVNLSNTYIKAYLNDEQIDASEIKYYHRQDVINAIKDYGTEEQNPEAGYSFKLNMSDMNEGKNNLRIELWYKDQILTTTNRIIKKDSAFHVKYRSFVDNIEWQKYVVDGNLSGTTGKAYKIEAMNIKLVNASEDAKILYRAHVQDEGWQNWKKDGEMTGSLGKARRIEAIQIKLENMDEYTVEYKVHVQDYGWSDWMIDGETAGTIGKSKRIEAIQIRVVPKYYRSYRGIDVSEHNGTINWSEVKNSGVQFAMIRCAYRGYRTGRIVEDAQFRNNIKGASENGIKVGLYFFSQATSIAEAVEEANYTLNLAKQYNCITYPIAIDTEMSGADNNDGRADGLNIALRTNVVVAFCETIKNNNYIPMVYASRDWFYNNLEISKISAYETWLAHYTGSSSNVSNYKYSYTMWQYTSSGSIPGISTSVDKNIGYKNY